MWLFYIICMKTKTNRVLYLSCDKGNSMKWSTNKNEACWFDNSSEANKFANQYFKTFKEWYITEIEEVI